jgi:hypothetical protein
MTTTKDVFDSFETSFADKIVVNNAVELIWLRKAVARYSVEINPIQFDYENNTFGETLNPYVIDTLAAFMKELYQEREVSRINKTISITGKDISINNGQGGKAAAANELAYANLKSEKMAANQKPTAYS